MRNAVIAVLVVVSILALPVGVAGAASKASRAAKRDAAHRLDTTPLPPRTHTVPQLPASLGLNGAPFAPATPNLVDEHSLLLTVLGPKNAFAWFKSHPPPKAGAGQLFSRGVNNSSRVIGFRWGNSPLVEERALYVTVIGRSGGGTAIRIDSQATWGDKGETA
jgi:hypothetical protein